MGPRTRHQLATKLADKGTPNDAAQSVLDRMTEVGLIDDEAFAHMFVRSQVDSRGLAPMALRHELRKKGVSDDLISLAVGEVEPDDQRATAQALVDKKLRAMHGLERVVQTRRLAGLLARKGYPAGLSYEVIREAIDALPPGASL
ncbi:recombination regulator RecX [Ornithinimicrobium sp. Arc0846-15]|nr:recombination regulator RecX [Ornithinimicrobium laminariae]